MLFSDKCNYSQVNWNYVVRNRYQRNILQIFEENHYIFILDLLIDFKFYKMQFQLLYFTFICYQLILIIELVPKMKYLCFDLMFLSEINQVILVAILLFLDLGSVLRVFFFVTFYFL